MAGGGSVMEPVKWAKLARWTIREFKMLPYLGAVIVIAYWHNNKTKETMTMYRGKSKMFGPITPPGKPAW
ncbi:hypothetical protein RvY_18515 [Ramazzottius varieornatus]|uniref:NADH-ubiquinone oxidoreductase MNLL subunit n=1 Tax=Ramazzottius varieornatus TaxID=947166 RepID=A0A1D1WBC0_RAMVA|nr:hypothetical protein RvY_18515 [Ramazzottius varieornatus]